MIDRETNWTDASVVEFAAGSDPVAKMEQEARCAILDAVDRGWQGPPFDPIKLANIMGIAVRPNAALADARVHWRNNRFLIEYNPHRPRGRVNFSIAHEIAHTFFPDCAATVRNRSRESWGKTSWQIEVLCNVGAAELTMPIGSFQSAKDAVVTIERLMNLRREFQVSAEAILIRLVKLASSSIACFSATKLLKSDNTAEYRIDYRIESSRWSEKTIHHTRALFRSRVLDECVAIGTTSKGTETWKPYGSRVHVEAVALPPLSGMENLRVVGFMRPASEAPNIREIEYRQGNAAVFAANANVAIMHIVNDRAQRWGPRGFARAVRVEHPTAHDDYAGWKTDDPKRRVLGSVHIADVQGDNRCVVSLVAQRGYGRSVAPRIQYGALDTALENACDSLRKAGVWMVQMPKIGTGQARGDWGVIEGLIRERLVSAGFQVRVIEPPPR